MIVLSSALLCLTQAVYFESRGEPLDGQRAVAEVVLNRVDSSRFPDDVCSVTSQDLGPKPWDCQFSYMCDGKPEDMTDELARKRAEEVAKDALESPRPLTDGALYFHANWTSPSWARRFEMTYEIGVHKFYKP